MTEQSDSEMMTGFEKRLKGMEATLTAAQKKLEEARDLGNRCVPESTERQLREFKAFRDAFLILQEGGIAADAEFVEILNHHIESLGQGVPVSASEVTESLKRYQNHILNIAEFNWKVRDLIEDISGCFVQRGGNLKKKESEQKDDEMSDEDDERVFPAVDEWLRVARPLYEQAKKWRDHFHSAATVIELLETECSRYPRDDPDGTKEDKDEAKDIYESMQKIIKELRQLTGKG
jgi:hypothetical protein